jgi:hypothetical protein
MLQRETRGGEGDVVPGDVGRIDQHGLEAFFPGAKS